MSKTVRLALLMLGALFASVAFAQPAPDDDPGDASDPPARVARLSYIHGAVSFVPAGENDWVEAQVNRPLITGDRLWTDHDSRVELELGTAAIRMDEQTAFDFLNLDDQAAQIELTQGSLNLRVRRLYDGQTYEIDTPTLAFVVNRVGEYRLSVAPDGDGTIVSILRGGGDAYGEDGARFRIEEGQSVVFNDPQLRDYETDSLPPPDDFDDFIAERDARWDHSRTRQYVAEDLIGYEDLDDYGDWDEVPEYGNVWYPTQVSVGWAPYHSGHWGWVGAYGWTWIDDSPWGFAPFHYGRWAYIHGRWGWCPGPRHVRPYYAPALVAFVGGGVSITVGGPVGWFPLGPRDVYFPGYHTSRHYFTSINISNTIVERTVINNYYVGYSRGQVDYASIHYHNRGVTGAVIAVPGSAFVSARPVRTAAIRVDRTTFANARVSGFAPIAPTRASLVAANAQAGRRPPERALDRRIVAATRPPAPVAPFAVREAKLRQNPGRPLDTRELRAAPAAAANARTAAPERERANVRVVTRTGTPATTPAAPLVTRGGAGARGVQRGNAERAGEARSATPANERGVQRGNAGEARSAMPANERGMQRGNAGETRSATPPNERGNARMANPNERPAAESNARMPSSRYAHPNAGDNRQESGRGTREVDTQRREPPAGNARGFDNAPARGNAPPREERGAQPNANANEAAQERAARRNEQGNRQQQYRAPVEQQAPREAPANENQYRRVEPQVRSEPAPRVERATPQYSSPRVETMQPRESRPQQSERMQQPQYQPQQAPQRVQQPQYQPPPQRAQPQYQAPQNQRAAQPQRSQGQDNGRGNERRKKDDDDRHDGGGHH